INNYVPQLMMGVVCVISYPMPDGKSGQQVVNNLQERVEMLGAAKTGTFSVDCETYHATATGANRMVHVLHNSQQPASCFAIVDTGTCLVADNLFDLIMLKLKSYYASRKNSKVESKGQRYELQDFAIKIGSVTIGQTMHFKGILVEVEYLPCMVPGECWHLMHEFMEGFMGIKIDNPPSYLKSKFDSVYTPSDTVQQYLEYFNIARKAVASTVAVATSAAR
ncbi:unnamed protein product, partial [Owenia fusiformis]